MHRFRFIIHFTTIIHFITNEKIEYCKMHTYIYGSKGVLLKEIVQNSTKMLEHY